MQSRPSPSFAHLAHHHARLVPLPTRAEEQVANATRLRLDGRWADQETIDATAEGRRAVSQLFG